jgi:hypothetical protein
VQDPFLAAGTASDPVAAAPHRTCGVGLRTAAAATRPATARAAASRKTVGEAVDRAARNAKITKEQRVEFLRIYEEALRAKTELDGARQRELASVIAVMDDLADRGLFTSSRMPALFLTLARNTEYWRANAAPKLPPSGQPCVAGVGYSLPRLSFGDDPVVFQWYPGHGLQIQVLGNFGKANALAAACLKAPPDPKAPCRADKLKALLDRLVALRSTRGGFTAWEYFFPFGGGKAPWLSGMAQATALQALARGSQVLGDPSYLEVARTAVGAFQTAAPTGIRVPADGGSHYLIYNFTPGVRVLNAFLQSLIGLYDYAKLSNDPAAQEAFAAGDRAARVEVPRYDTGAWSLYSLGQGESNLDYHKLVRDFLGRLCERTAADVYCRTADRFSAYLRQTPRLSFTGRQAARRRRPATVRMWVSKVSCIEVAVIRAGRRSFSAHYVFNRGMRSFTFVPARRGTYRLAVVAKDLAGNRAVLRGALRVR